MAQIQPRVPEPKRYGGNTQTLETWLYSVKQYFKVIGWEHDEDDSEKCANYTVALLEGAALQWHHRQSLTNNAPVHFGNLENGLRTQFGILDVERRARDKLKTIMQKGSVSDYVKQFEQVIMYLPQATEAEMLHAFTYGLKSHIRSHVLLHQPNTVNDAQTMALTVDDRQDTHVGFRPSNNNQRRSNNSNSGQNRDIVPMEIGNMSRSNGNKGKRRQSNNSGQAQQQQQQRTQYRNNKYNSRRNKGKQAPPPNPCMHCGGNHWNKDCRKQPARFNNLEHNFRQLSLAESDAAETSAHPHWESCSTCQQNLHYRGPNQ